MRQTVSTLLFLATLAGMQGEPLAIVKNYFPIPDSELPQPFALQQVASWSGDALADREISAGPSGASLRFDSEKRDLIVTGTDLEQKAWSFEMGLGAMGGKAYVADLDGDGTKDVVLVSYTGACGLGPPNHIVTLLFDPAGRPVPFESDGYSDAGDAGIDDIVDLDGDGKAELLYMNYDGGYWITNVYKAQGARWHRVKGSLGKHRFPLYTRFTDKPNRRSVSPAAGRIPNAPDLSNDSPRLRGQLASSEWGEAERSGDLSLRVKDPRGKASTLHPSTWAGSFAAVLDLPEGRTAVSLSANQDVLKALLARIISDAHPVALFGQRKADGSDAELLWAQGAAPSTGKQQPAKP